MLQRLLNHQIVKFTVVGFSALLVHLLIVWLLVHLLDWHPLSANVFGFLGAVNVSYLGHLHYTFKQSQQLSFASYARFFAVASVGFLINQGVYFYALHWFGHRFYLPILFSILLGLAFITYSLSKFWAFKANAVTRH